MTTAPVVTQRVDLQRLDRLAGRAHRTQSREVDVGPGELGDATKDPHSTRRRGQEPTVATRRIEHPHRTSSGRAPGDEFGGDRVGHDVLHQRVGRVPRAEALAFVRREHRIEVDRATLRDVIYGSSVSLGTVTGRYLNFDRSEWAMLRAATPLTLRQDDLDELRGINERIDLDEVATIYLSLTRLLNLYVSATQNLQKVTSTFLGALAPKVPYVIGVAGSVAVGKSTFARILQALLARWPDHPQVGLITTDGFLHPNRVLDERGIMNRKGFPESYDTKRLLDFLRHV